MFSKIFIGLFGDYPHNVGMCRTELLQVIYTLFLDFVVSEIFGMMLEI